jgi:hypothetical protein
VTHFEVMLLERLDTMTSEMGRLATAVGRLEERQIAHDDRLDELEKTPPPHHVTRQYNSRGRTAARDGGLVISGGAVSVILSAVLNHFAAPVPPPAPAPAQRAPTYIEAPK